MEDLFEDDDSLQPPPPPHPAAPSVIGREAARQPLADKLRPSSFDDFLGQEKLVGPGAPLRRLIESDRIPSMILWGPPGSGKTTLAMLIARATESDFITLSAVGAGVKDVRAVVESAKQNRQYARRTILFVDEIHRFNKAQQDAFLPHVESGLITLMGATTENPSFSVISPLLSRSRVFVLGALAPGHLRRLLERGVELLNRGLGEGRTISVGAEALDAIAGLCDGDARRALGMLEIAADVVAADLPPGGEAALTREIIRDTVQRHLLYDRSGEEHYNLISALHKTIRSSDPHGALYWCERMLVAGEDPRYLLRRLVRIATEDVGLADPNAVQHGIACLRAFEAVGQPEGDLFVTQLAVYLALAPKSNALYKASKDVRAEIERSGTLPVPMHLRNAPTGLMKELGYGDGYTYDHDSEEGFVAKQGLPDKLAGKRFYRPGRAGYEGEARERLEGLDRKRAALRDPSKGKGRCG
ncbi:MAG: putative ATPase [Candidatus Sumerlaeota bacterium]|nr:putative ATPase [Candidatus Sumerlaeota bacterium]